MTISTIEEVQQWVKDSTITWRIDRTRPPKGQRVIFKVCLLYTVMLGIVLGQKNHLELYCDEGFFDNRNEDRGRRQPGRSAVKPKMQSVWPGPRNSVNPTNLVPPPQKKGPVEYTWSVNVY